MSTVPAKNKLTDGDDEEDDENDAEEELEKGDPEQAQRSLEKMLNENLSEAELRQRQDRYEREAAMGYFLQPITIQKIKKKIYFYDDLVLQMEAEFKQRVSAKRECI